MCVWWLAPCPDSVQCCPMVLLDGLTMLPPSSAAPLAPPPPPQTLGGFLSDEAHPEYRSRCLAVLRGGGPVTALRMLQRLHCERAWMVARKYIPGPASLPTVPLHVPYAAPLSAVRSSKAGEGMVLVDPFPTRAPLNSEHRRRRWVLGAYHGYGVGGREEGKGGRSLGALVALGVGVMGK